MTPSHPFLNFATPLTSQVTSMERSEALILVIVMYFFVFCFWTIVASRVWRDPWDQ